MMRIHMCGEHLSGVNHYIIFHLPHIHTCRESYVCIQLVGVDLLKVIWKIEVD